MIKMHRKGNIIVIEAFSDGHLTKLIEFNAKHFSSISYDHFGYMGINIMGVEHGLACNYEHVVKLRKLLKLS